MLIVRMLMLIANILMLIAEMLMLIERNSEDADAERGDALEEVIRKKKLGGAPG